MTNYSPTEIWCLSSWYSENCSCQDLQWQFHFNLYPTRLLWGMWHSSFSPWNSFLGFYGTIVMVITTMYIVYNTQCTVATDGVGNLHLNKKGRHLHDSVKTSGLECWGSICLHVTTWLQEMECRFESQSFWIQSPGFSPLTHLSALDFLSPLWLLIFLSPLWAHVFMIPISTGTLQDSGLGPSLFFVKSCWNILPEPWIRLRFINAPAQLFLHSRPRCNCVRHFGWLLPGLLCSSPFSALVLLR